MLRFQMATIENDRRPRKKTGALQFDPATYLDTVAKGRSISTHRKGDKFFAKARPLMQFSTSKKGKSKSL
jgi:hypothetical protein